MTVYQLIAYLFMTLQHTYALWPESYQLAPLILGQIAFPLFVYDIAQGVRHTSDFQGYFLRLICLGAVSEPVYYSIFHHFGNVVLALSCYALILKLYKKYPCAIALVAPMFFFHPAYFFGGVLAVFIISFDGWELLFWSAFVLIAWDLHLGIFPCKVFGLAFIPIVALGRGYLRCSFLKLKYLYYPLHLLVINHFNLLVIP